MIAFSITLSSGSQLSETDFILPCEARTFVFFLTSGSFPFFACLDRLLCLFIISQMPLQKSPLKGCCFSRVQSFWPCVLHDKVILCPLFNSLYKLSLLQQLLFACFLPLVSPVKAVTHLLACVPPRYAPDPLTRGTTGVGSLWAPSSSGYSMILTLGVTFRGFSSSGAT